MTRLGVEEALALVFTAAGRGYEEPEVVVYELALAGHDDDQVLGEAAVALIREVDLWQRPPTPKLLLDYVRRVEAEHRARTPAIRTDTSLCGPPDPRYLAWRAKRRKGPDPAAVTRPTVTTPNAHEFGEHDLCGPDCPANQPAKGDHDDGVRSD